VKVCILEVGKLPTLLEKKFGNYTSMFSNLFQQLNISIDLETFEITKFHYPTNPKTADLWLITGSSFGVYEDLAWIGQLKQFIKQIVIEKIGLLGICFGHQIIAEAMGGKVQKSEKGWGVGLHQYERFCEPAWTQKLGPNFAGYASHQDQVTTAPTCSYTVYGSNFCPHAVLAYGSKDKPIAISIQSHPEFSDDLLRALIKRRIGKTIPRLIGEKALKSLKKKPKNSEVFKSLLGAIDI
jgi:GMP synthase-like glutamine amidotransferase